MAFYSVADMSARSNALLAGQVDLLSQTNLDFATARVVAASDRATIARVKNAQWYVLPMLTTEKPFTDVRVRQAMKLAYDPEHMVKVALQGAGTPAGTTRYRRAIPRTSPRIRSTTRRRRSTC